MSVVSIDIMSKRGERRKYLPLEIRMRIYDDVLRLHEKELSNSQIQKRIYEKYGKQISLSRIGDWINGKYDPLRKVNKFDGKPSPELEYINGVMFSDGFKYFDNGKYILCLSVKDKEFAEEFGRCLAKVLGKKEPYKPFWNKNRRQWIVAVCSVQLFKFLDRPLEELKPYIEYSKETVASFLRALFDAEGSIYKRKLCLYNTDKELLSYVQYLLKKFFNIDSTIHLAIKKGSINHFPNGKVYKANQDEYYLYIHARSLLNFYEHIGFTIKRKQQRLIEVIQ
jgi:intein-encoded DNA endonuclease-like protein